MGMLVEADGFFLFESEGRGKRRVWLRDVTGGVRGVEFEWLW